MSDVRSDISPRCGLTVGTIDYVLETRLGLHGDFMSGQCAPSPPPRVLGMTIGNASDRGMFLRFNDYHHDIAIFKTGDDADLPKDNQVGLGFISRPFDIEPVPVQASK